MQGISDGRLFRQTLVVLLAAGFAVILWRLTDLILLLLAGALVAFIFYKFAHQIEHRLKAPFPVALSLAVILPILFIALVFWAFGSLMADQFAILFDKLPAAFTYAQTWLRSSEIGRELTTRAGSFMPEGSRIVALLQTIAGSLGTAVTSLGVVLVAGIYLAAQPRLYGRGVLHLIPPQHRQKTVSTVRAIMEALSAWLKAQGMAMVFIGVFSSIAFSLVGLPAAPALGLVAGICEFVPYLGTFVVAIPAIILGFSISPETGVWTAVAIVTVQQVQGNIVSPLLQSRMVEMPPALTIFSLIAAGVILGPMGVILAVPLTVVGLTLIRELVTYSHPAEGEVSAPPADSGPSGA